MTTLPPIEKNILPLAVRDVLHNLVADALAALTFVVLLIALAWAGHIL